VFVNFGDGEYGTKWPAHHKSMDISGWEARYRSGESGNEQTPTALLVETIESLTPGTAIDLACGTGRNALYLAQKGWAVTAVDGAATAIQQLQSRSAALQLQITTQIADLAQPEFTLPPATFDLILIAYYLQRDLFEKARAALRPGGVMIAIVHTPETGEPWSSKRAAPGELQSFFSGWPLLWEYEGPSRDPAHRRPVAEVVARRPLSG
jgi:tellurite methyltransferase